MIPKLHGTLKKKIFLMEFKCNTVMLFLNVAVHFFVCLSVILTNQAASKIVLKARKWKIKTGIAVGPVLNPFDLFWLIIKF